VLMLSNIKSPALYFQAAFRAQNPHEVVDEGTGELLRKENAYVFDFAPDRTLILYDAFANNLSGELVQGTTGERQTGIRELINFFPVIAQDDQGTMRELDPNDILTIPSQIKAAEVVRRGFMSNLLFANISAIFSAPQAIRDILNKIAPEKNTRLGEKKEIKVTDPSLDDDGEAVIPQEIVISTTHGLFGEGIYVNRVEEILEKVGGLLDRNSAAALIARDVIRDQSEGFVKAKEELGLTNRVLEVVKEKAVKALETRVEESLFQHEQQQREAEEAYRGDLIKLATQEEKARRETAYRQEQEALKQHLAEAIKKDLQAVQQEAVASRLITTEEQKKKATEDEVRDHLRGFARTIPAFLMAYGDKSTTLATFEQNIHAQTFLELTSITVEEFKKLRDGFPYEDEQGQQRTFPCLFDEVVFNASVREFFDTKERLKDYVHHIEDEDIFDYIPPQKTNQIFTPKRVVKMMVDLLQQQAPGLFESKHTTFIDLYSKSGLYLSEIVKRLFASLKSQIPDDQERIKWILECQVYGCAPSNIIYNMIRNYVYAGYPQADTDKLAELDLIEDAKAGTVEKALKQKWGKNVKFDVIIGNPPYQEQTIDTSDNPIYHLFMKESYKLAEKVCFITPARFLFNAGKTPKHWNEKMLNDEHLKVVLFEPESRKIFPDVEIKGGIAITYRDAHEKYRSLGVFLPDTELYSILAKVCANMSDGLDSIVYSQNKFNLDVLLSDFPSCKEFIGSNGTEKRLTTLILTTVDAFKNDAQSNRDVGIVGVINNKRVMRFIDKKYLEDSKNLHCYKALLPFSNGSGAFGEVISTPTVAGPNTGYTQTFIGIGCFITENEAKSVQKYVKTKFARAMLGTRKITQHNSKPTWENVPFQDFTTKSDIDWSRSISEIDQLLYRKYGLTQDEISFIEGKVSSME
jgi:type I restriction-modification system DNA methylase subunit